MYLCKHETELVALCGVGRSVDGRPLGDGRRERRDGRAETLRSAPVHGRANLWIVLIVAVKENNKSVYTWQTELLSIVVSRLRSIPHIVSPPVSKVMHSSSMSAIVSPHILHATISNHAFPAAAASVWNSLSELVWTLLSLPVFRSGLKLFAQTYTTVLTRTIYFAFSTPWLLCYCDLSLQS